MKNEVIVLRLGHRPERDKRVTTHTALVARALGASKVIIVGEKDENILESVKGVTNRWGGKFKINFSENIKKEILKLKKQKFTIIHLTMYGLKVRKEIAKIRKNKKIAIIVGAEKVPFEVYKMADFNISITGQPHSEIAALAIFLHELFKGKELETKFANAKLKIIPQKNSKKVIK
ncbi:MAG: tRNA (cytidine(56)-2'-O)-methyltransferase [archaeon]|nr:tRNA (cytidine(56)-2'-O)-methyltransferase [archaeon]